VKAADSAAVAGICDDYAYREFCAGRLAEPYEVYDELRRTDPVHWSDLANCWILTRYRDVERVLQHDLRWTAERFTRLLAHVPDGPNLHLVKQHLSAMVQYYDPPDHTRLRKTVGLTFTPRVVGQLRDSIRATIDRLVSELAAADEVDLIGSFAHPLPAIVISDILGVPPEDRHRLREWADDITRFMEGVEDDPVAVTNRTAETVREMVVYLTELIASRRGRPRNDLLTHLVGEHDRGSLSEQELFAWAIFLLDAGHETTTGLIGNGIAALLQHPDQLASLRRGKINLESAVEELLRYDSPIQRISRVALEDFELDGQTLKRGQWVWAMIGAANRDPDQFENPDVLDLARRPNRHLAFGYGVHFCLGAALARLEGCLAVGALLNTFPNLRLAGQPQRWQGVSLHRYTNLPVRMR
jgi:pimeloyl-[acyl-carrier protein] synthase